ncbi:STAS domain-containing protein [Streptomyces lavendofoliae]|uniref:STAS domain-containing protein n=1 Tax=Streptomyces lavendofoliae TaxID=67314 RepID=UPI003D8D23A8
MNQAHLTVSQRTPADGVRVLAPAGEIDHTTTAILRQALESKDGRARHTVIDFHDVTFMDSSGINILVAANNAAQARGSRLSLAHTPQPVRDLLHIVGLDDVLVLYPTLHEALEAQHAA